MGSLTNFALGILVVALAALYQSNVHFVLYTGVRLFFGIGHTLEPLSAFPYKCRRIEDERLQACEDMWLSEATRQLFLACSEPKGRQQWSPNGGSYNASGRSLTDHIAVLDIDEPAGAGFNLRVLQTPGYPGTHGDGRLNLLGMDGHDDDADGGVRLWLIDAKPSVDLATGQVLEDQAAAGGNQTVEVFRTGREAAELEHLESFWHPLIMTPNRVAAVGDDTNAFWVTNDLGHSESRWKRNLAPLLSQGSLVHCSSSSSTGGGGDPQTTCTAATIPGGLAYPNGLVHNRHDGRLYVPSSLLGTVAVYETAKNGSSSPGLITKMAATVNTRYALDNLMADQRGDVWAAAFPVPKDMVAAFADPYGEHGTASAVLRIRRRRAVDDDDDGGSAYEVEKVLEDGRGEVLPVATSVVHDATTGRLFLSSVVSPFIAVCDKV